LGGREGRDLPPPPPPPKKKKKKKKKKKINKIKLIKNDKIEIVHFIGGG